MKRLLIPLVLLLLGLGGGVGAGLLLSPAPEEAADLTHPCGAVAAEGDSPGNVHEDLPATAEHGADLSQEHHSEGGDAHEATGNGALGEDGRPAFDYVKLNNQFVVPLLTDGQVDSLVLLSLSVEVPTGQEETVLMLEPRLRDSFLQVLFDHANTGGFDGLFTAGSNMRDLRDALLDAANRVGAGLVTDVLILDLVRQEQ